MNSKNKTQKETFWKSNDFKVALFTAFISIIIMGLTNHTLEKIEVQKYQYTLHETKFEKLQESLEYFMRFKVVDEKYIEKFDVRSIEDSAFEILDMAIDSTNEFSVQSELMLLYIGDEAFKKMVDAGVLNDPMDSAELIIDITGLSDSEKNQEIRLYLKKMNEVYAYYADRIVDGIKYDIETNYIPKEESEDGKEMNFDSVLETYPVLDIVWELFKGISPTLIAIGTIWVNTILTKERANKEERAREIKELQSMAADIVPQIMELYTNAIDLLGCTKSSDNKYEIAKSIDAQKEKVSLKVAHLVTYADIRRQSIKYERLSFSTINKEFLNFTEAIENTKMYCLHSVISDKVNEQYKKELLEKEKSLLEKILSYGMDEK